VSVFVVFDGTGDDAILTTSGADADDDDAAGVVSTELLVERRPNTAGATMPRGFDSSGGAGACFAFATAPFAPPFALASLGLRLSGLEMGADNGTEIGADEDADAALAMDARRPCAAGSVTGDAAPLLTLLSVCGSRFVRLDGEPTGDDAIDDALERGTICGTATWRKCLFFGLPPPGDPIGVVVSELRRDAANDDGATDTPASLSTE
jgi:hypothetical protein